MTAIHANAHALARYAALCQAAQIVPIVEPEVLMDGDHDIDRCYEVSQRVLDETFQELRIQRVALEGMVLKPNMVVPGKNSPKQAAVEEIAEKTVRLLKNCVPAAVPGIAFLSGGQSDEQATAHLDAMNRIGGLPWRPRAAGGAAEGVVGQGREPRRGPARLHPSRPDEFARRQRRMEGRSGKEGGIDLATKPVPSRPVPRLYLATPELDDASPLAASLPGLLAEADVAAVLVRLKPADPRTMITRVKALAPAIQGKGAALLLDGHVELVARAGADGAHLTGIEALGEALPTLKPDRIAGVGGLTTRHDSMTAAEAGADYVLFGEPDARGQRPSAEAIAERLQWWAELFEPPCVGFAASREEAHRFAAAGADFVLVGDLIWNDVRGAAAALMDAEQAIRQACAAMPAKAKAEQG